MTRHEIIQEMQAEPSGGGMTVIIPSVVMKDPALSRSAKMLYGIITWKCNEFAYCWYSNRTLGEELGLSGKRVSALISELSAQGHIEMEIIKDEGGAIIQRRIYPIVKSARGLLDPHPKNEHTPPQEQGDPHPKNEQENKREELKIENTTSHNPPTRPRRTKADPVYCPQRFEQLWQIWPGGGSRAKAVAAWDKLAPDDALIDVMAHALKRQMQSEQWQRGIGIPHLSTWLNGSGWRDKVQPPRPQSDPPPDSGGWANDPEVMT